MRLLTRSDFDGLGCAALLRELGMLDEIKFVHPKDVQDGQFEATSDDILANVPYIEGCGLWFDHHSSEVERDAAGHFEGCSDPTAPSAASVIWDFYGGGDAFTNPLIRELIEAVNKADSADLTTEEVLHPEGWVLISFIMDPRTGLGRYRDYRISNYQLMLDMIDYCRIKTADEILEIDDVKERATRYAQQATSFLEMIGANSTACGDVVTLDLRDQDEIFVGNRFVLYSLFPEQNISIQVIWGREKRNVVMTCGHSIINRSSQVDVGSLMLKHGGGGHRCVGTCQVPIEDADRILAELVEQMNASAHQQSPVASSAD